MNPRAFRPTQRAPSRAMTRGSPNRSAGDLLPSSVRVDCATRSKAGLARTQPPDTFSIEQAGVDGTCFGLQFI